METEKPQAKRFPRLYDVEWLERRYVDEQASTYGVELGCSNVSVRNALIRAGIARRGRGGPPAKALHRACPI